MTEQAQPSEAQDLVIIAPTPVSEDEKATLHLAEQDGQVTLEATGGTGIPVRIPVLNEDGNVIAVYSPVTVTPEGRTAIVGLASERWGQFTLGRQPDIADEASEFTSVKDLG
ncbi:hypothetical protein [Nocardia arthritidis]|uniref:Uncharacterized protein n=1 Tax=Nocardia arthritidis TaxID=228602 RepID=A0A6G9YA37_9NOCA|nr:hypothetical protein [Nocardia arthritidis]QIS10081.1 hypothetical protein F5544_10930 [Nocardia arthritidis]